jgi:hypothetical protein
MLPCTTTKIVTLLSTKTTIFFFEQGMRSRRTASFHSLSGGSINYKEGPAESRNYSQTLTFCTKDLGKKIGKAIGSSSSTIADEHDTGNLNSAGDGTTWGGEAGAHCIVAERPP